MENIELGLLLMVVGMVTVFVILLIVIWLSQLLISIVNKVAPEEAPKRRWLLQVHLPMLVQWMPLRRLWIY